METSYTFFDLQRLIKGRSCCNERFISKNENKTKCFLKWNIVSPLERLWVKQSSLHGKYGCQNKKLFFSYWINAGSCNESSGTKSSIRDGIVQQCSSETDKLFDTRHRRSLFIISQTPHLTTLFPLGLMYIIVQGGRVLPIMAYTGRLHPKEIPFSGFRYMKS